MLIGQLRPGGESGVERGQDDLLQLGPAKALGRGRHYEAWVLHDGRMFPAARFTGGGMLMLRPRVRSGDRVAVTTEPDHTVVVRSERA